MSHVLLHHCLGFADRVERAVLELGATHGTLAALPARCAAFREACESIASNRGLQRLTVAFIGPRNAGKTTLLAQLVTDPAIRGQLPRGVEHAGSTRRLLWVGPEAPADLDARAEQWIPCAATALPELGVPCQLVDVPGFDDRDPEVRAAANRALDSALVKVLVVEQRQLEAFAVQEHLSASDGSLVLPVVNQAGDAEVAETAAFAAALKEAVPAARVLAPLVVPDFERREEDEGTVLACACEQLTATLREALTDQVGTGAWAASLAQPQLQARLARFRNEVQRTASTALPATSESLTELEAALHELPEKALGGLLDTPHTLQLAIRGRFRARLLEHTPLLFFPWRLTLGIANLVWGALDRLPLMLLGSLPSWASAGMAAVRNLRQSRSLETATTEGLRAEAEEVAEALIRPKLRAFEESLRADLRQTRDEHPKLVATRDLRVEGLGLLQSRSVAVFREALEQQAPGRVAAMVAGLPGVLIFWGLFVWPLVAVYQDYLRASLGVWNQSTEAARLFPADLGGLLLSAALLAWAPMAAWLLLSVGWLSRQGRARRCAEEIQARRDQAVKELLADGLLSLESTHRRQMACRVLLTGDAART